MPCRATPAWPQPCPKRVGAAPPAFAQAGFARTEPAQAGVAQASLGRSRPRPGSSFTPSPGRRGGGFTLVSVVFILVVLTALGAGLANVAMRQQMGSAAEVESARAMQAARAGLEWAAFQVLRNPAPPAAAPSCFGTSSFTAAGLANYTVTVSCTRTPSSGTVSDGATALVFYQLVANACSAPSSGACPSSAAAPERSYVERQLTWTVVR